MSAVKNPIQIMQGEADAFVPQAFGRHLAANLANAQLQLLPGKGHLLPFSADFRKAMFSRARQLQEMPVGR